VLVCSADGTVTVPRTQPQHREMENARFGRNEQEMATSRLGASLPLRRTTDRTDA
jgi:hypothetical protein